MGPCYQDNEAVYPQLMMTPPPDKMAGSPPEMPLPARQTSTSNRHTCTPESLPGTVSSRRQSSISSVRTYVRRQSTASDLIFSPRGYQELYTERAYLSSALQTQYLRATDLIRQYSSAEEELRDVDTARQRRRLRKQLSLLRSKLNDAGNQERALLIRLSELCVELQSHETWKQAQREWRASHQSTMSTDTAPSYSALPPTSYVPEEPPSIARTSLNGATPEFVPRAMTVDVVESSQSTGLETMEEAGEDYSCNHGLAYEYICEDTCDTDTQGRPSLDGEHMSPLERRLSLPNIQSMWP